MTTSEKITALTDAGLARDAGEARAMLIGMGEISDSELPAGNRCIARDIRRGRCCAIPAHRRR